MDIALCFGLLELTEKQDEIIAKQNKLIAKLTTDNLEKENMINELMQQEEYLY